MAGNVYVRIFVMTGQNFCGLIKVLFIARNVLRIVFALGKKAISAMVYVISINILHLLQGIFIAEIKKVPE